MKLCCVTYFNTNLDHRGPKPTKVQLAGRYLRRSPRPNLRRYQAGAHARTYTRTYAGAPARTYTRTYTGTYAGAHARPYNRTYTGT